MDALGLEIRQAARRLLGAPGFAMAAALTLALAIGANASIFAVVHRVVLNPLPYPESNRVIVLAHAGTLGNRVGLAPGIYYHYRDRAGTLESVAIYDQFEATITGGDQPERLEAARVTASLAAVLRVQPLAGRWFGETELRPGAPQLAVLSHPLWVRRYGGDTSIIGRPVTVDGVATEIIGVMPPGFVFPEPAVQMWVGDPVTRGTEFGFISYQGVARLRRGASLGDARAELTRLLGELPDAYPGSPLATNLVTRIKLTSAAVTLKDATVGDVERALWILLVSVSLVLLVAGANVSNLFMVRSDSRAREVAVRRALGADSAAIRRYFLAESAILSVIAGAGALVLAWGTLQLLVWFEPARLPRLRELRIDAFVVAFTGLLTLLAAVMLGAVPLLRAAPLTASLHETARGVTSGRARQHARQVLVGAQIALALVLLASSALMVRSFQNLRAIDPGFNAESALTFRIGLPRSEYSDSNAIVAAHQALVETLAAIPGVTAVSASNCLPLENVRCVGNSLTVEGQEIRDGQLPATVWLHGVAGGFFDAMGMRLLRGRGIDRGDVDRRQLVVVVNQALVDAYFPGRDPIGQRVLTRARGPAATIVGVVSNTPRTALAEQTRVPKLYMPMSVIGPPDAPDRLLGPDPAAVNYVVRTMTPTPTEVVPDIRRAVHAIDPNLALAQVRTLEDILDSASAYLAFTMVLLTIAAGVALALGLIGTYAVISYVVSQRTHEIGLRLALGANPQRVAAMIVRQGGTVALAGAAAGVAVSLAGGSLIESLLYGVSPRDPALLGATTLVLLGVAVAACWVPARRASRIEPALALRAE